MKKLSLASPTILLMVGVPGSGKSFFARQFAESFGLPRVCSDRIWCDLFNEPQYSPSEQQIVHRVTDYITDELLQTGTSFVVDSTLSNPKTQRLNIERRARQHGYKVLVIWVQVDELTAKNRSAVRKPGKKDDLFNKPLPDPVFAAWNKQLAAPSSEAHIVISGKHTFATQRSAVLRRLELQSDETHNDNRPSSPRIDIKDTPSRPEVTPLPAKVVTPTPSRRMGKPAERPSDRRIIIS